MDLDEAVSTALFGIFVDETTGVDGRHLRAVQSGDFLEVAGVGNASELREEKRDAVAAVLLDLLVPTRDLEG